MDLKYKMLHKLLKMENINCYGHESPNKDKDWQKKLKFFSHLILGLMLFKLMV